MRLLSLSLSLLFSLCCAVPQTAQELSHLKRRDLAGYLQFVTGQQLSHLVKDKGWAALAEQHAPFLEVPMLLLVLLLRRVQLLLLVVVVVVLAVVELALVLLLVLVLVLLLLLLLLPLLFLRSVQRKLYQCCLYKQCGCT